MVTVGSREAVDNRLGNGIGTDNHGEFLAAGHIDDTLVHRRRAGALAADNVVGIIRATVNAVKYPLVGNLDAVDLSIGLAIGHRKRIDCSGEHKHKEKY